MKRTKTLERRRALVVDLAVALHEAGAPAHRLEERVDEVCRGLGLNGRSFATPTALTFVFGRGAGQHVRFERVSPYGLSLRRLDALDSLAQAVASGEVSEAQARVELADVLVPRPVGLVRLTSAFAAASATAAVLLGGHLGDALVAAVAGLVVGMFVRVVDDQPALGPVLEVGAAALAGFVCAMLAPLVGQSAPLVATTSALIALVPGFGFTVALTEVSSGHLASGTARLASVLGTLLALGVGAALGSAMAPSATVALAWSPGAVGPWLEWTCVVAGGLAFGVLFDARPGDLGTAALAGAWAYGAVLVGAAAFGPDLGAALGGVAVAGAAVAYRQVAGRPGALIEVPGTMMLVPGSMGFRSIARLMSDDVLAGVQTAVGMAATAGALCAGLLLVHSLAAVSLPRRVAA